jgi:hypothetical protein
MTDLEPIGDSVEEVLHRLGIPAVASLARLVEEWAQIAGERWAVAEPVGLAAGVLVVEVGDGLHASLLRYDVAALLERLSNHVGEGVITSVRIRVREVRKRR